MVVKTVRATSLLLPSHCPCSCPGGDTRCPARSSPLLQTAVCATTAITNMLLRERVKYIFVMQPPAIAARARLLRLFQAVARSCQTKGLVNAAAALGNLGDDCTEVAQGRSYSCNVHALACTSRFWYARGGREWIAARPTPCMLNLLPRTYHMHEVWLPACSQVLLYTAARDPRDPSRTGESCGDSSTSKAVGARLHTRPDLRD